MTTTITLQNLSLEVSTPEGARRTILEPTSLKITEQTVAVIGANGSGKSTLLRLIAGLAEPTAGRISFAPHSPRTGFIFANPQAQLVMPVVGEDIEFSLKQVGVPRARRREKAQEILDRLGLASRMDSSVYELSSGELQKVALAGVLAAEPELVLADEPTTLLDLRNAAAFRHRLLSLDAQLIVATHDLDFAARTDRVLVFGNGRIQYDGAAADAVAWYRERELAAE